jgi:hypothetical protein
MSLKLYEIKAFTAERELMIMVYALWLVVSVSERCAVCVVIYTVNVETLCSSEMLVICTKLPLNV